MRPSKLFIFLLVFGIVIRIFVALWSLNFRENTDILRWRDWGRISYLYGLSETYKTDYLSFGTLPNNMPPGTLYVASSMYMANLYTNRVLLKLYHVEEGSFHWMNSLLPNGFLRIPSIVADICIALIIYWLIKKKTNDKSAILGMSLFFFNPAVFYNSSFWGQMDSINNLFFLISLALLLKKRITLGLSAYFLSLYVKLSLLFAAPLVLLLAFLFLKKNVLKLFKSVVLSSGLILLLTMPISKEQPYWIFNFLSKNATGEMQNITAFAFNFWWFIFKPTIEIGKPLTTFEFSEIKLLNSPLSQQTFGPLSLETFGFIFFITVSVPLFLFFFKRKTESIRLETYSLVFSLIVMVGFIFLPRMHERYLYPIFPLLALYAGLSNKKYLNLYIALSVINLINVYLVWHPMLPPYIPYELMINTNFQWVLSALTVILFIFFYITALRNIFNNEKK